MLSFEWDQANLDHIARHGVTFEEAEEALNSDTLELEYAEIHGEQRMHELGATATGRILKVVTIIRNGKVRVVTAYDASRQMKLAYLMEKGVRYE